MKTLLWIFIVISMIDFPNEHLFSENAPESCTVFTASVGDTVLFGNNEDVGDKNATICFLPATEKTYGLVYFEFQNYPIWNGHFPMGGLNDQGLCFDITSIPVSAMNSHPKKLLTGNPGFFGEMILKTCKTVEEAALFIEQYNLSSFGDVQFLFADKTGDAIVLCPGADGEMKVIEKKGVYQVITNFNMLKKQLGGFPCWRYSTTSEMLAKIKSEHDLTVEYVVDILKNASREGTTYSTVYDPVHGVVYFYNKHNFDDVVVFDLKDQLEKGYHTYYAPSLFLKEEPLKESEGTTPVPLKSTPFQPLSALVLAIPTAVLFILIFVYKKMKK